jgi:hypothetical protein
VESLGGCVTPQSRALIARFEWWAHGRRRAGVLLAGAPTVGSSSGRGPGAADVTRRRVSAGSLPSPVSTVS